MIVKVLAGLLILAMAGNVWQRIEVASYQHQVASLKADKSALQGVANTLHEANQTNVATIASLNATIGEWKDKCTANQSEARQQAQASVQGDAKRRVESAVSIKKLRDEAKHDTSVKTWMDADVPPSVIMALRG